MQTIYFRLKNGDLCYFTELFLAGLDLSHQFLLFLPNLAYFFVLAVLLFMCFARAPLFAQIVSFRNERPKD